MRRKQSIDYGKAKVRREILIRQRRELWTPEQVASLAKHFRLKPGMKMLDVGCGFGYALRTWGQYCLPGGELVGLDRDKKLLAQAARFCSKEGLGKAAQFVAGDIYSLPFSGSTFDMVLAHVVFCHLARPEKALDEMVRAARPGGCIAVFDNALGNGLPAGLASWVAPSVQQLVFDYEVSIRWRNGRHKLGYGDMAVGCRVPGWMESRGLEDVGVRTNERVRWIAPPYRSPGQRTFYRNERERMREKVRWPDPDKTDVEMLRAGGLSRRDCERHRKRSRNVYRAFRDEMRNGTAAFTYASPFWCVWGFKP
jgi:SAM-dependent methyltransferase